MGALLTAAVCQVKLEELKVRSVEEKEKKLEEQKKHMLKERAEASVPPRDGQGKECVCRNGHVDGCWQIKAQELTDLEHSMLRKRKQILVPLAQSDAGQPVRVLRLSSVVVPSTVPSHATPAVGARE